MKKLLNVKVVLIIVGLLIAALFAIKYITDSNGLKITDAQLLYKQSLLSLDSEEVTLTATVIKGNHPWGIKSATTILGGDSNLVETYLETDANTLRIFDDGTSVKVLAKDNSDYIGIEFKYSESNALDQYLEILRSTGLIFNLNNLLQETVESTEFSNKFSSTSVGGKVSIPTLIKLASVESRFAEFLPHKAFRVTYNSGIFTTDKVTGELTKATLEYSYNKEEYTVELKVEANKPIEIEQLGELVQYSDISNLEDSEILKVVKELVGGSLADQLEDIYKANDQDYIVSMVDIFARNELYYPTSIELRNFILDLNPNDSTILTVYTPLPEGCTNQEEDYCSSYEIVVDLSYDGYGGRDADSDLRDLVITP